jgi:hypothetical protein
VTAVDDDTERCFELLVAQLHAELAIIERHPLAVVAHHEAGHVVAAVALGIEVESATITPAPADGVAGRVIVPDMVDGCGVEHYADRAAMLWAGPLAAARYQRGVDVGDAEDRAQIRRLATLATLGDGEVAAFETWTRTRATVVIRDRWPAVCAVAAALVDCHELSGEQARRIVARTPMQRVRSAG